MKIRNRVALGVMIITCICCIILFLQMPDNVPVHFDIAGEVDKFGSKLELLLLPVMSVGMWIILYIMARRKSKSGNEDEAKVVSDINISLMAFLFCFNGYYFLTCGGYIASVSTEGEKLIPRIIMIIVSIVSIVVGNVLPKVSRNLVIGVRTPWSMKNDVLWMKNQRIGGFVIVLSGLIGLILNLFLPHPYGTIPSFIIFGVALIFSTLYSVIIYFKYKDK